MPKRTKGKGERGEILDINGDIQRTRKDMVLLARELRGTMTKEEQLLWDRLRGKKLQGIRFYRQVPIDRYVVDFYCPSYGLIIELDGGIHQETNQHEHDQLRDAYLRERGFCILRIPNKKIMHDLQGVVCSILDACTKTKTPPPRRAYPVPEHFDYEYKICDWYRGSARGGRGEGEKKGGKQIQ